jgi:hypothetical protein
MRDGEIDEREREDTHAVGESTTTIVVGPVTITPPRSAADARTNC